MQRRPPRVSPPYPLVPSPTPCRSFRLSGSGRYEPGGTVRLDVSARSTQYGPLALAVRGTAERPQAVLRAESPGLGVGLRNLVARVEGEATGYHVDAEGEDRKSTRLNSSH